MTTKTLPIDVSRATTAIVRKARAGAQAEYDAIPPEHRRPLDVGAAGAEVGAADREGGEWQWLRN